MENYKGDFYEPEHEAEYGGFDDELVDTIDSEFDDFDDDSAEYDDFDDDSADFAEFGDDDDDDESFGDDDDDDDDSEFLGIGSALAGAAAPFMINRGIGAAISGVKGILSGRGSRRSRPRRLRSRRYTSGAPKVARRIGTASRSNLLGRIRTRSGRSVSFKLPPNVATKRDISALKRGISINAKAIRSNTKGVKANAKSIISTSSRLSSVDKKHTTASKTQNKILNTLNRRVSKVKSELDKAQEQQKMMQMFQFMMPPEIESIKVAEAANATPTKVYNTVEAEFKTNLMPMMMAMGSGGSGSGGMMDNPMMMFFMMDAFNNDK